MRRTCRPIASGRPARASRRRCGRARPAACRAARGRSRHSRARCARAAARTAGTPWRRCACGCRAASRSSQLRDVDRCAVVLDQHRAAGDLVEPVDGAQQRRLAGAGQAHQHADLAALDREADAGRARARARSRPGSRRGCAPSSMQRQRRACGRRRRRCRRCWNSTAGHGSGPPLAGASGRLQTRSSTIASMTMARPASKPMRDVDRC